MKKMMIILMLFAFAFCFAETEMSLDLTPNTTFEQLSKQTHIPIKKLSTLLNGKYEKETTIAEAELNKNQIEDAIEKFSNKKEGYYWSIVLIGMLIVFCSLMLTGFLIGLLKHLNLIDKFKEEREARKSKPIIKKISTVDGNMSNDEIVAVVTAIYLHELDVEEKNKMNLTWKRAPLSMWQAASKVNLPNRIFFRSRRKF